MNILACYKKGIGEASSRPKVVLIQWLLNAVFASLAYVLFSTVLASALGRSGLAAELMNKADMNVLFEALATSGRPLGVLLASLLALILIYFLVSIFVHGGILRGLVDGSEKRRSGRVFFAGGAGYYGRFLRLTVYSVLLWVPALIVFAAVSAIVSVATKDSTNEQLSFVLTILRIVVALFLIFLIKMIMDYARIRIAVEGTNRIFHAMLGSLQFVFRRPVLTLGLYYLLGLTGWVIFAAWKVLYSVLPMSSVGTVWVGFLLTQLFIVSRGWLRIAYQAAQMANLPGRGEVHV
jgi:hypothetical protein